MFLPSIHPPPPPPPARFSMGGVSSAQNWEARLCQKHEISTRDATENTGVRGKMQEDKKKDREKRNPENTHIRNTHIHTAPPSFVPPCPPSRRNASDREMRREVRRRGRRGDARDKAGAEGRGANTVVRARKGKRVEVKSRVLLPETTGWWLLMVGGGGVRRSCKMRKVLQMLIWLPGFVVNMPRAREHWASPR
jgi:hypothetical protein